MMMTLWTGGTSDSLGLLRWKRMHFIHVNARGLLPKLDEIGHLATTSKAAVIAVLETWPDNIQYSIFTILDGEVGLTGYYDRRDRNRHGGGVCLFKKSDITFNPRHDPQVDGLESAWIEVILLKPSPSLWVSVTTHLNKQTSTISLNLSVVKAIYAYKSIIATK